jgi:hypothetical protein
MGAGQTLDLYSAAQLPAGLREIKLGVLEVRLALTIELAKSALPRCATRYMGFVAPNQRYDCATCVAVAAHVALWWHPQTPGCRICRKAASAAAVVVHDYTVPSRNLACVCSTCLSCARAREPYAGLLNDDQQNDVLLPQSPARSCCRIQSNQLSNQYVCLCR